MTMFATHARHLFSIYPTISGRSIQYDIADQYLSGAISLTTFLHLEIYWAIYWIE
ncbi:hypothetical protein [Yersinia mollaretii]|uniref:hypothetical protein n=1 Tax=Yersinia mollaretii TaxID=33060 RepID=UPI001643DE58|nr:hypothetical protein [Yersinia mollaretii]